MAIGDAVAAFLGTGTVNRQPAVGVEEQISSIIKPALTDAINLYDGTNTLVIIALNIGTSAGLGVSTQSGIASPANLAIMITNSVYLRKTGTTDRIYIGGVQTNA